MKLPEDVYMKDDYLQIIQGLPKHKILGGFLEALDLMQIAL